MKILSIDTSQKNTNAILEIDNQFYIHSSNNFIPHSKTLMLDIDNLLKQGNINVSELDAISVVIGPGSFTGCRLSISIAKGLAFPHNIKLIGISSLELLKHMSEATNNDYVILKGIAQEIFVLNKEQQYLDDIFNISKIAEKEKVYCFKDDKLEIVNQIEIDYNIKKLADLSHKKFNLSEFTNIENLRPLYLRECQAEIELKRKQNASNL